MKPDLPQLAALLPRFLPGESPSSWAMRAARWLGITPRAFVKHLRCEMPIRDADELILQEPFMQLAAACDPAGVAVPTARRVIGNLVKIPDATRWICRLGSRTADYAFCAACFSEMPVGFLQLSWRFVHWEVCHRHGTQTRSRCPQCAATVRTTYCLLNAGSKRSGLPCVRYCRECSCDLAATYKEDRGRASPLPTAAARNLNAVRAALLHGHFWFDGGFWLPIADVRFRTGHELGPNVRGSLDPPTLDDYRALVKSSYRAANAHDHHLATRRREQASAVLEWIRANSHSKGQDQQCLLETM